MPYELAVVANFSAAHKLSGYPGKCANLHGHNWKVEVFFEGESLNEIGIVEDLSFLKEKVKAQVDSLDHKYLNELPIFSDIPPSSENIAKYLYDKLKDSVNSERCRISAVRVWESETASVTYREKDL